MKKILLSLFVGFVGIISFCNSFSYFNNDKTSVSVARSTSNVVVYSGYLYDRYVWCFTPDNSSVSCSFKRMSDGYTVSNITSSKEYCAFNNHIEGNVSFNVICSNTSTSNHNIIWYNMNLENFLNTYLNNNCPSCPTCPTCPSCQTCTGYKLNIYGDGPSYSLDITGDLSLYKGENVSLALYTYPDIFLSSTCQNGSGEICGSGDLLRSNIYINNILHPGRQFINIEIPDYITWDYSVSDDDFNLYVGSGYDVDYINSVIDINSYRPTSEDFTNVFVSGLTLVMPYIVIALFIIFVRKLIKGIFK